MPTRQEITDSLEVRISQEMPRLVTKQTAYLAARGRYFQGLTTHSTLPADGAIVAADRLASKPTDQAESWTDVGYDLTNPRSSLTLDAYVSGDGPGYTATFRVRVAGQVWRRVVNVGPEAHRDLDWTKEV